MFDIGHRPTRLVDYHDPSHERPVHRDFHRTVHELVVRYTVLYGNKARNYADSRIMNVPK